MGGAAPLERGVIGVVAVIAVVALSATWIHDDRVVVGRPPDNPGAVPAIGALIKAHTPANATILLDGDQYLEPNAHMMIMFWAQRDVYQIGSVRGTDICPLAREAEMHGSPAYVVSRPRYESAALGSVSGWTLYAPACPPAGA